MPSIVGTWGVREPQSLRAAGRWHGAPRIYLHGDTAAVLVSTHTAA